jgi:hypothetical protein
VNRKLLLATAAVVTGFVFVNAPGIAAPSTALNAVKAAPLAERSIVQKAGYWNRCRWGIGGYHKWVPGVGRIQCTARKCWRNSWGIRRCRWY